jgi:hypothetical protein
MVKKELYETLNDERFAMHIGKMTGKLIIEPNETISLEKEEVSDLIQILKDFYVRMD